MTTDLWHKAWPENAALIMKEGFRDGLHGRDYTCLMRPHDTHYGGWLNAAIEVTLDLSEDDLRERGYVSETDITLDDGRKIPQVDYHIPADVLNEHSIRKRMLTRREDGTWQQEPYELDQVDAT